MISASPPGSPPRFACVCIASCKALHGLYEWKAQSKDPKSFKDWFTQATPHEHGPQCKFVPELLTSGKGSSIVENKRKLKGNPKDCPSRSAYTSYFLGGKCVNKECPGDYQEMGRLMKDVCVKKECPPKYNKCA